MTDLKLKVWDKFYGGWQRIRVRLSMQCIAGSFELAVTDKWIGQSTPRPIRTGQECTVLLNNEPVITGYVEKVQSKRDSKNHSIRVVGRDRTGDLVDCSAPSTAFKGQTLLQVATLLCEPHKVYAVSDILDTAIFKSLKNSEGDTVFDTLEAAARVRGVLLMSDGLGGLHITRAGLKKAKGALVYGGNVKGCTADFSTTDRFSKYTVKGQHAGSDDTFGAAAAGVTAIALDGDIHRHRPLTILAEQNVDQTTAQARATWERNVRKGRANPITYTVSSWTDAGGSLWRPNTLVPVRDAELEINGIRLISDVDYVLDDEGERAEISVIDPLAFTLLATGEADDKSVF